MCEIITTRIKGVSTVVCLKTGLPIIEVTQSGMFCSKRCEIEDGTVAIAQYIHLISRLYKKGENNEQSETES